MWRYERDRADHLARQNAELEALLPASREAYHEELINDNIRYKVVDRLNGAMKASGVQGTVKAVTVRALKMAGKKTPGHNASDPTNK